MHPWFVSLCVALALTGLEWRVTAWQCGTKWSGFGAMPGVWRGASSRPQLHRVLVPGILWPIRKRIGWQILLGYIIVRGALLWGAMWTLMEWQGVTVAAVVAVGYAVTIEFDYWSQAAELFAVSLILTGTESGVAAGVLVWALSKETCWLAVPMVGVIAWRELGTVDAGMAMGGLVLGLTILIRGSIVWHMGWKPLYCERVMLFRHNLPELFDLKMWKGMDPQPLSAAVLTALGLVASFAPMPGVLGDTRWVVWVLLAAGWIGARSRETRVFLPVWIWIGGAVV